MQLQRLKVDFEKQKEQASLGGALKGAKIVGKMSGLSKEMPRGGGGGDPSSAVVCRGGGRREG
jgi:hypothetical protein